MMLREGKRYRTRGGGIVEVTCPIGPVNPNRVSGLVVDAGRDPGERRPLDPLREGNSQVWERDGCYAGAGPDDPRSIVEEVTEPDTKEEGMRITMDMEVRTRSGRPVTLLSVDGQEPYPVVGYFEGDGMPVGPQGWTRDGRFLEHDTDPFPYDLVPAPREEVRWLAMFRKRGESGMDYSHSAVFASQAAARHYASDRGYQLIGLTKVRVTEGVFDEED